MLQRTGRGQVAATGGASSRVLPSLLHYSTVWMGDQGRGPSGSVQIGGNPIEAGRSKEPRHSPRLQVAHCACLLPFQPSNRAYSSSITLSSSFLKSGAGCRNICPGGSSLFVQACTERSECVATSSFPSFALGTGGIHGHNAQTLFVLTERLMISGT